jgi:hypothetical protein
MKRLVNLYKMQGRDGESTQVFERQQRFAPQLGFRRIAVLIGGPSSNVTIR